METAYIECLMAFKFYKTRSRSTKQGGQTVKSLVTKQYLMVFGRQTFPPSSFCLDKPKSELGLPVVGLSQLVGKLCSAEVQKNDNSPKMAASGGKDILCASPPEISRDEILSDFPLHWHVWHKDSSSLEEELAVNKVCV